MVRMHRLFGVVFQEQFWCKSDLSGVQNLIGVATVSNNAVFSLGCRATLMWSACTGSWAVGKSSIMGLGFVFRIYI